MATVLNLLGEALGVMERHPLATGWYSYATDSQGHRVRCAPEAEQAECFCTLGALYRGARNLGIADAMPLVTACVARLRSTLMDHYGTKSKIPNWNDVPSRKKEHVIELFQAAINDERMGAPINPEVQARDAS